MPRAAWILAVTTLVAVVAAVWLYADNRHLRAQLAAVPAPAPSIPAPPPTVVPEPAPATPPPPGKPSASAAALPSLPPTKDESRLERRQRWQAELTAKFGRLDGETEDEYRARVMPLIAAGLTLPRMRMDEMRKEIEEKANVTPAQSKQLDAAFDKAYEQALDYTNKAIADGTLSPYERNVSGWLELAGGLGGILTDANTEIATILTPQQVQSIGSSGFDWSEYLAAKAPWEKLNPPPPPK